MSLSWKEFRQIRFNIISHHHYLIFQSVLCCISFFSWLLTHTQITTRGGKFRVYSY